MRTAKRVSILVLAITLAATATVSAQGVAKLDVVGGRGGTYFEQMCGPGRVLVGVQGWAGVWIDNVQAVCARLDLNGVSDSRPEGRVFGGDGGERPIGHQCRDGAVAAAFRVHGNNPNPFIGELELGCLDFSRKPASGTSIAGTGNILSGSFYGGGSCPPGAVAVGIAGRAGKFLDAFGLICATTPMPLKPGVSDLVGRDVSFESVNFPGRFIRHKHALGVLEPAVDELARKDTTFRIVRGLAGRCFSLESHNYPDHFLRHQQFRVKLAKRTPDPLFQSDATFCIVAGLSSAEGASFEPVNLAGHHVRHRGLELWVDRFDGSEVFVKDATFQIRPASTGSR